MSSLPGRRLTQPQKVAVIVRLLAGGGVDPGLRDLPQDQQRRIVNEMTRLRFVDRQTLAETVAEFAAELDNIGLHFPRDVPHIVGALSDQLSLDLVEQLLAESGQEPGALGDSAWEMIAGLEPSALGELLAGETDEVAAILLSKLPAKAAADLLATLEPDRSEAIAVAFGRTEEVSPSAVSRIGAALGRQSASRTAQAFGSDAASRIGDILNSATSALRGTMLAKLEKTDPEFAKRIRGSIFSYEGIPSRVDPRDVPKIMRGLDGSTLTVAIAGAPKELAEVGEFILGSISSRLADQLKEEMEELGTVTSEAAEDAMAAIASAVRELEAEGEITLLAPEAPPTEP
ncbi:MAG: FliG C-terminal domain-containing protein [Pseudomonadota bacterium]